ncbi:MAG: ribosomal L7Ae/L30e/S12e/Gadd45 family protein [Oscillospiraceae bacterium]|nr:ribosomal L7Ae/L30e/S12e/Gadd45 family protein [Oscillospiraceae bacterium]
MIKVRTDRPVTDKRIYGFIGIAKKAGVVTSGGAACEDSIAIGKAKLVIIAEDSADSTKKRIQRLATSRGFEVRIFGTCGELGKYCGKNGRSVLTINNDSFAGRLKLMIDVSFRINGGGSIG